MENLFSDLSLLEIMGFFFTTTIGVTVITEFFKFIAKPSKTVKNYFWSKKRKITILSEGSIWQDMENGKMELLPEMNDLCVEIFKNGIVITQGLVQNYNSESFPRELLLGNVETIRVYLDNDKLEDDRDLKMFPDILYEYYNVEQDIVIRIYDNTKFIEAFRETE